MVELLSAFNRISEGTAELMLVAGFSGIGKTAVVNEVHKPIVRQQGYFIKGKYDQFNRNIPLSAFVQALRDLMRQLLCEDDDRLAQWQTNIKTALGENARVIIEVIPELEQIVGQQLPVPTLSGSAAQNRFNLVFQKFIQVFTTPTHPLVIFLDDLQWADSASLNLMQVLMSQSEGGYLLLIGAYRDNEVSPAHPLMLTLEELKKANATVNIMTLAALNQRSLNALVADTLQCGGAVAQPLSELVYQKTKGNPFFSTQFLKALHEDGWIEFDAQVGHWQCDLAKVRSLSLTDDVVEFMAMQLQKLPRATQNLLRLAACIGNQFADAIAVALVILRQLGVELPAATQENVAAAFQSVSDAMVERLPAELLDLPENTDETLLAVARILTFVALTAYLFEPLLYTLVVLKKVYLSVVYGNEPTSTFGYVSYGILMCGAIKNFELGYEFGQLALTLRSRTQNSELKAKTLCLVNAFTRHWKMHLRETLHPLQMAYSSGLDVGDLAFAGYSTHIYGFYSYFAGENLTQLELEIAEYCQALKHLKQTVALTYCQLLRQVLLNLTGRADNVVMLSGIAYDEQQQVPFYEAMGDRNGLAFLWIHKLVLSYLFSEFEQAADQAEQARRYLDTVPGYMHVPIFHFYESLAYLALLPQRSAPEQQQMEEYIAANQEKFKDWAARASMNFQHKYDLVEAERHRVLGQRAEAIEYYDRAITGAKEYKYVQEEALANELAAKFYLNWGKEKVAASYLQEAYYCYARWGAKAKIADLETRYPELLAPILQQTRSALSVNTTVVSSSGGGSTASSSTIADALDFAAILKAGQALSSEIELDKLFSTLLQVVIANAGADKCVLLLSHEGRLMVQAIARFDFCPILLNPHPIEDSQDVPVSLINTVKRSLQPVVIIDATVDIQFIHDSYIQQQQPKSILCSPILHQGKLLGILYLENNLVTGAFTFARVELLNLLCAQAAISLENARLYQKSLAHAQQLEIALQELQYAQLQLVQSEKMSALGNLVAGVAHEINNPVGFIAGNLQPALDYIEDTFGLIDLYQQEYPNSSTAIQNKMAAIELEYIREDLPKLIGSMKLGVQRIRDISTSLRIFSRADKDYKVPFNIHSGIDSTISILKHRLKANDARPAIEVVTDYGNLPEIECFPGQLNQVFMNVLANAIDAIEESFVNGYWLSANGKIPTMTIRTYLTSSCNAQRMTHDKEQLTHDSVAVQIQDNGIGMTDDVKQKIFDHLFTTKGVGKGTGLGLAIARQIVVEKHGGAIEFYSTLGQGTEFIITLPIKVS